MKAGWVTGVVRATFAFTSMDFSLHEADRGWRQRRRAFCEKAKLWFDSAKYLRAFLNSTHTADHWIASNTPSKNKYSRKDPNQQCKKIRNHQSFDQNRKPNASFMLNQSKNVSLNFFLSIATTNTKR